MIGAYRSPKSVAKEGQNFAEVALGAALVPAQSKRRLLGFHGDDFENAVEIVPYHQPPHGRAGDFRCAIFRLLAGLSWIVLMSIAAAQSTFPSPEASPSGFSFSLMI
jgi:hypothetical protein